MEVTIPAVYIDDKLLHREGPVLVDHEGEDYCAGYYTDGECESVVFESSLLDPLSQVDADNET